MAASEFVTVEPFTHAGHHYVHGEVVPAEVAELFAQHVVRRLVPEAEPHTEA